MDEKKQSLKENNKQVAEELKANVTETAPPPTTGASGCPGWGFSPLSVLSDLQKAATAAAEEISRNAAAVAHTASKSIVDLQNISEDSESLKDEEGAERSANEKESDNERDKLRKSALSKLEKASEDSILSQGLRVLDNSVENFASGAWNVLGSAWKGGTGLVQRLENSAADLAGTIQHGGPGSAGFVAPSLLESGKAFTAKGMQVLEYVVKETMELLITETGIEVENAEKEAREQIDEDQLLEEVTFDRCFYIYGGPEQLEELAALSNHYALLYNRRKAKLLPEQKSVYDGKLKEVQQIFNLSTEIVGSDTNSNKGKTVERGLEGSSDEMKNLPDSSVSKAAEMAACFTKALAGLADNDITQRTSGRLESLHSEGVPRLSEMCCFVVSQLLMFGKSIISWTNEIEDKEADEGRVKIEWPEDVASKAEIIRINAQTMIGYVEAVPIFSLQVDFLALPLYSRCCLQKLQKYFSFGILTHVSGISDVTEAYQAAMKAVAAESHEVIPGNSVLEKASAFSDYLRADQTTAVSKIQDGLLFLSYIVLSTSMDAA